MLIFSLQIYYDYYDYYEDYYYDYDDYYEDEEFTSPTRQQQASDDDEKEKKNIFAEAGDSETDILLVGQGLV